LERFITAFKKAINKIKNLDTAPPDKCHPILFIQALFEVWTIWAECQQSNSRNDTTKLSLTVLIEDITDNNRNKEKRADGSSALYRGKPNPEKKCKGNKSKEDKDKSGKSEGKLCKNCKNPRAKHSPDNCFITNKKLRREW
jgi:hypothetical protein